MFTIKEYDVVKLKDGTVALVIDVTHPGIAYLVEVPTPNGPHRYDEFFVEHEDIVEVLPDDYEMINPYEYSE